MYKLIILYVSFCNLFLPVFRIYQQDTQSSFLLPVIEYFTLWLATYY